MMRIIPQTHRRTIGLALAVGIVALGSMLAATPARAEVAVHLGQNNPYPDTVIISIVGIIIDDGDPMVWDSLRPDSPTHFVLNPNGAVNGDGPPHLIRKGSQSVLAVWAKNLGTRYEIVMSEFTGSGWSTEQTLAATVDNALDPTLVRNPTTGGYDLLYWTDGATPTVWRKQAPADLSSWSNAEAVSLPGEAALRPSAVYFNDELHVVYEVHADAQGAGPHEIALAVDDAASGPGTYQFSTVTVTPYLGVHRPKLNTAGGRMWVEWVDTDNLVCWDRQVQAGVWDGIGEEPFGSLEERVIHTPGRVRALALD